jgi:two-component system response regulator MprA
MQQDLQQDTQERRHLTHLLFNNEENSTELPQTLTFGDLHLDTEKRKVTRAGRHIELTATEYSLLALFMRYPRKILDRQTILNQVWGYDFLGESNIIEVYVRYLREKIEDVPGSPRLILTVRGIGYVLKG